MLYFDQMFRMDEEIVDLSDYDTYYMTRVGARQGGLGNCLSEDC